MKTIGLDESPENIMRRDLYVRLNQQAGGDPSLVLDMLATSVENKLWEKFNMDFRSFVTAPFSKGGLEWTLPNLEATLKMQHRLERPDVSDQRERRRLDHMRTVITDLLVPEHQDPGNPTGNNQHEIKEKRKPDNIRNPQYGNDPEYIKSRLRDEQPELYQQIVDKQLSPHQAAIQAGFRKKTTTVTVTPEGFVAKIKRLFTPEEISQIITMLSS